LLDRYPYEQPRNTTGHAVRTIEADPEVWRDTTTAFHFALPPLSYPALPPLYHDHDYISPFGHRGSSSARRDRMPEQAQSSIPAASTRSQPDLDDLMSQIDREIPYSQIEPDKISRLPSRYQDGAYLTPRSHPGPSGIESGPRKSHDSDLADPEWLSLMPVSSRLASLIHNTPLRDGLPESPATSRYPARSRTTNQSLSHFSHHSSFPPSTFDPFLPSDEVEMNGVSQYGTTRAEWGKLWSEAKNEL
jgi:hypothetical protein